MPDLDLGQCRQSDNQGMPTIEEMEAIAKEHGIAFLLDHLGLDGLANKVVSMRAALGSALGYIEPDVDSDDPSTDSAYYVCEQIREALDA